MTERDFSWMKELDLRPGDAYYEELHELLTRPDDPSLPAIDLYGRISVTDDGRVIKVPVQLRLLIEEVRRRGARPGKVYVDQGKSAFLEDVVRDGFLAMMTSMEAGTSDGVIFYETKRLTRQVGEGERLIRAAKRGLLVWSMHGEYNLTTAYGRQKFREDVLKATGDSDEKAEAIKRGQWRRANEKMRLPGGNRGYGIPRWGPKPAGWERGDFRPRISDDQINFERAVLRDCAERILGGQKINALAIELNERGIPSVRGKQWTGVSLKASLCRPAVAGLICHEGEIVGRAIGIEPILTRGEWERMVSILNGRRNGRARATHQHLASGTPQCGNCLGLIGGRKMPWTTPYDDGEVKCEYRCRRDAGHLGCGANRIDARVMDAAIDEGMRRKLADPAVAHEFASRLSFVQDNQNVMYNELAALKETSQNIFAQVEEWGVEGVTIAQRPVLRQIALLEEKISQLSKKSPDPADTKAALRAWARARKSKDLTQARAMIKRVFPMLTLMPGEYRGDNRVERILFEGLPPKQFANIPS